jgi:hypothetical protein
MWWAVAAFLWSQAIQDRWCASRSRLNPDWAPTQMAIPLQMEIFLNSWSLQQERA